MSGIKVTDGSNHSFCEGFIEGKMCRRSFKQVGELKSTRRLLLVPSDVCGPMQVNLWGERYFATFIDDYSSCCLVYFIQHKSEILEKFKDIEALTTNQTGLEIGTMRTDNRGKYLSNEFEEYLKLKETHHEVAVPYTLQSRMELQRG